MSTSPVWWTTKDVQEYLGLPSRKWAQVWMWRNRVRRSGANKRFTCKEWVDAALNKKGSRA